MFKWNSVLAKASQLLSRALQGEHESPRDQGTKTARTGASADSAGPMKKDDKFNPRPSPAELLTIEGFVGAVSRELRTPLGVIQGHTDMLLEGGLSAEEVKASLLSIHRNSQVQAQIINDLLDLSGLMSGQLIPQKRAMKIDGVLLTAVNAMQNSFAAKNIKLRTEVEPAIGSVNLDPRLLLQAFRHILSNAVKFTPANGWIHIRLFRKEAWVILEIADSGKGISPQFLPLAFDLFQQEVSGTTREHGGMGLGLTLARLIVEAHGGNISVDSSGGGEGTKLTLAFPLMKQVSKDLPASQMEYLGKKKALENLCVLVIDDDLDTRKLLGLVLERAGAQVLTANGRNEALELYDSFSPSLIVSDIGMPQCDGYELIRMLTQKAREAGTSFQAVALTAHSRLEDKQKSLEAGFRLHLTKPLDPQVLVAHLETLSLVSTSISKT